MVTIGKAEGIPFFSVLRGVVKDPKNPPHVEFTDVGKAIRYEITKLQEAYPQIYIPRYVIMPDHVHMIVFFKERTTEPLGRIIAAFKVNCGKRYSQGEAISLFDEGFHDRILRGRGQLEAMNRYIADNPRRLMIKRNFPELFRKVLYVRIAGIEKIYALYGNVFLLDNPNKEAVKVSRKYTEEELARKESAWMEVIEIGGVLVSPFYNPKEKIWRDKAIAEGASLIIIRDNGFRERFAPEGRYFDLCAEGRLLMVAPVEHKMSEPKLSYANARILNNLAEAIASPALAYTLRRQV